jgi:hypothetical protein
VRHRRSWCGAVPLLEDKSSGAARSGIEPRRRLIEIEDGRVGPGLAQIGQELGVATILEAAVQRAGDRVRITAQLAEAASGKQLWGSSYDRELTPNNVFELQSAAP